MAFFIGETCDGCTACARRCPVAAISGQRKERHAIIMDLCIDCGACGHVCRRDAVFDADGQLAGHVPREARLRPVVDPDRCNGCELCVVFCAFGCLEVDGRRFDGVAVLSHPNACVSCGECGRICGKAAIRFVPASAVSLAMENPPLHSRDTSV